jgi:hypothetical protein
MLDPFPTADKAIKALAGTPMLLVLVLLNLSGLALRECTQTVARGKP